MNDIIETQHGTAQILSEERKGFYLIRFTNTGSTVLASSRKIKNGTVKDPLVLGKPRWEMKLANGTTHTARFLDEFCEITGLSLALIQKIATKDRTRESITYINKI